MEIKLIWYFLQLLSSSAGTFKDCWDGCYSELYSGNISVTFSGLACQPWTANTPHEHVYSHRLWGEIVEWIPAENSNYCRDPLGHGGHPYCYTVEPLVKQQQCNVPVCEYKCCWERGKSSLYIGRQSISKSGLTCQSWSDQSPNQHRFTKDSMFPGNETVVDASNYCRDLDGSGQPWCYVSHGRRRRDYCEIPICNDQVNFCGGVFREQSGWFSPDFRNYISVEQSYCLWTIIADQDKVVELFLHDIGESRVSSAYTECSWSLELKMYDGPTAEDNLIDEFICGQDHMRRIVSSSSTLSIYFKQYVEGPGVFNATYSQVKEVGTCGRTLNSATGWLSPEHVDNNGNYENNLDCWWTVVASDGYIVQLYIVEMDIAESQNCKGDYLEIFLLDYDTVLGRFCGTIRPSIDTQLSKMITVHFHSNQLRTGEGFLALYSTTQQSQKPCNESLNQVSGFITGFLEGSSPTDDNCEWTILANSGNHVKLIFVEMDHSVDCHSYDLQIYDGLKGDELLYQSSCQVIAPPVIVSSTNALLVKKYDVDSSYRILLVFVALYFTDVKGNGPVSPTWPEGNYAVPVPIFGCGDPETNHWQTGYINITFKQQINLFTRNNLQENKDETLLLGPYSAHSLQMNFCSKQSGSQTLNDIDQTGVKWPPGNYSVYGMNNTCPTGFEAEYVSRDIPEVQHVNRDGLLPFIEISSTGNGSRVDLLLCHREEVTQSRDFIQATSSFVLLSEKQNFDGNTDFDFIPESLFLSSTDQHGKLKTYDWFDYQIYVPTDLDYFTTTSSDNTEKYAPWELGLPEHYSVGDHWKSVREDGFPTFAEKVGRLMFDLGQRVSISNLRIVKAKTPSYYDGRTTEIPNILLSDIPWYVVSNGALYCLQSVLRLKYRIDIRCHNSGTTFAGRYLVLMFKHSSESRMLNLILERIWKVQMISAEKSGRCNQYLGVTDSSISDIQFSASSEQDGYPAKNARRFNSGWCANPDDKTPFLQVDLLLHTYVEGIKIFNWRDFKETGNGTYGRGMGVYYFGVKSSSTLSGPEINQTKKYFYSDFTVPIDLEQVFLFSTPVAARYITVYPLTEIDDRGLKCLKIELIGCVRSDYLTRSCPAEDPSSQEWIKVDFIHMSLFDVYSMSKISRKAKSPEQCILLCQDWNRYCSAVIFNGTEDSCYWPPVSSWYMKILTTVHADNDTIIFINICASGTDIDSYMTLVYPSKDMNWKSIETITIVGLTISTLNFPYYYKRGGLWYWRILNFYDNGYINMVFPNVSFNIYKGQREIANTEKRYSDKVDRLYALHTYNDEFSYNHCLSTDNLLSYCDIDVIDSDSNGKLVYIRTHMRFDYKLILRTWTEELPIEVHGEGIRIYAFVSEYALCDHICLRSKEEIESPSFLGQEATDTWFEWRLILDQFFGYIKLSFLDYDIGCGSGTLLEISSFSTVETYCNLNKPIVDLKSNGRQMYVRYFHKRKKDNLFEGFKSLYEMIQVLPPSVEPVDSITIRRLVPVIEGDTKETVVTKQAYKVCSQVYRKCYIITKISSTDDSWSDFDSRVCGANDWSLLSLHSLEEQNFLGYYVMSIDFNLNDLSSQGNTAYIGLQREVSTKGGFSYKWNDNTAVSFKSWALGEPKPSSSSRVDCTRIVFDVATSHSWQIIPCGLTNMADYGVCQHLFEPLNNTSEEESNAKKFEETPLHFLNISKELVSNYYHCEGGETISLIGICDGQRDCFYGNDEMNCKVDASTCSKGEFRCEDGMCIALSLFCDYYPDCLDGSDEFCNYQPCRSDEFQCKNYACISDQLLCDGKHDCIDGSDEIDCGKINCNNGMAFLCGTQCIPSPFVCDGEADCPDRSDESNCELPNTCRDWWIAGYKETGVYSIHGVDMECDFRGNSSANRKILTKYHHIDYERYLQRTSDYSSHPLLFENRIAVENLIWEHTPNVYPTYGCYQYFDETCDPILQISRKFGFTLGKESCECTRGVQWVTDSNYYGIECDMEPADAFAGDVAMQWFEFRYSILVPDDLRIGYAQEIQFDPLPPEEFRLAVNPIECISDIPAMESRIPCGFGFSTENEMRCRYDLDDFNHIIGCRSLAHLQGCASFTCPNDFFKCPESYCLQDRLVCDGIKQCENGEDENDCDKRVCSSKYRCLNSSICLTNKYLCDGHRNCPSGDDERLCDFSCPDKCTCFGAVVDCRHLNNKKENQSDIKSNEIKLAPGTKMLDLSTNAELFNTLKLEIQFLYLLFDLNISNCRIEDIDANFFQSLTNLRSLDISYNRLSMLHSLMFRNLLRLKNLRIDGNFDILSIEAETFVGLSALDDLELSFLHLGRISKNAFSSAKFVTLDLTSNTIDAIDDQAFEQLEIQNLFLNGSIVKSFSKDMFKGLNSIEQLVTDEYVFCCIKPSSLSAEKCYPQKDEFSSCSDLMRNEALRVLIWLIGLFALTGNVLSLIYRFIYERAKMKLGFGIFVTNLAISDFMMGMYLIIIAGADAVLRGEYIFNDKAWRTSIWCTFAGILAFVSSEASTFLAALITVDRFIVMKYPFGQVRLTPVKATSLSGAAWALSFLFAIIPVFATPYFKGVFYSKTGVCLALPLTRDRPPGWLYSIFIFIALNSITFVLIAFGQWLIYKEVQASKKSLAGKQAKRKQDSTISRNLLLVVATDFLCWFPIGIFGILAMAGLTIPGEVYAWTAVFVLPVNSALNPFLYSLSAILRKQPAEQDDNEKQQAELYTEADIVQLMRLWRNPRFLHATTYPRKLLSLAKYLHRPRLRYQNCVRIAVGLLKCLDTLHDQDLLQDNLSIEDIRLDTSKVVLSKVFLICRPKMESKQSRKAANMQIFGILLSQLVQRYDDQHKSAIY